MRRSSRIAALSSDAAAWEAVLHDPSLAIVDPVFLQEGVGRRSSSPSRAPRSGSGSVHGPRAALTVAALAPSDYYIANGVFMGLPGASKFFGYPLADRLYVALAPRVDPDEFAADVEATFLRNGTEAVGIGTIMDEGFTMTNQIFQLFQGYLAMGLIVGIADRGRRHPRRPRTAPPDRDAARDRLPRPPGRPDVRGRDRLRCRRGDGDRRRARARHPLRHRRAERLLGRGPLLGPLSEPRVLLLGTVGASLLATVWPAISASRIRPAVALRMTD